MAPFDMDAPADLRAEGELPELSEETLSAPADLRFEGPVPETVNQDMEL